jgi:hypothetical protein
VVRSSFVPPRFDAALDEALTPTRADVLAAKQLVLETLSARGAMYTPDLENVARERPATGSPSKSSCSGGSPSR